MDFQEDSQKSMFTLPNITQWS